ncbi:hypothetical protein ACROYT_G018792 [Oculina patagonica]
MRCFNILVAFLWCCTIHALSYSDARKHSDGANIAFLIDSSGSMGKTNYKRLKTFVKEFMTKLVENSSQFEAAVVLYSTRASVKLNFSQKFTLQLFHSTINNLPWERGYTRTDKALNVASDYIFTNDTLSRRQNVPMIAILITDGKATDKFPDFVSAGNASEPLKQKGVRIFAFGVGNNIDLQELFEITERINDVFRVFSFFTLLEIVDTLVSKVLSAIGKNSNPLDTQ